MRKRKLSKLIGKCKHCDAPIYTYNDEWVHAHNAYIHCRAFNVETGEFEYFKAEPLPLSVKIEG